MNNIKKIDTTYFNECLSLIKETFLDRNKRLGFELDEGDAKMTPELLSKMFNTSNFYAYFLDNKIIGLLVLRIEDTFIKLSEIAVLPKYQNKGIGSKLICFAKKQLNINNKDILKLGMIYDNKQLLNWYEKEGFKITEIIKYPNAKTTVAKMEYRKGDIYE